MNYCELKKKTNTGWNTWNTLNVLSYSHLPEGFTINLCITEYSDTKVLRESLIGRGGQFDEKIFPGARTYDGSCTQLNLKFHALELDIKTVVDNDEQIVIVEPLKYGIKVPTMTIEVCLLCGKEGYIAK